MNKYLLNAIKHRMNTNEKESPQSSSWEWKKENVLTWHQLFEFYLHTDRWQHESRPLKQTNVI